MVHSMYSYIHKTFVCSESRQHRAPISGPHKGRPGACWPRKILAAGIRVFPSKVCHEISLREWSTRRPLTSVFLVIFQTLKHLQRDARRLAGSRHKILVTSPSIFDFFPRDWPLQSRRRLRVKQRTIPTYLPQAGKSYLPQLLSLRS